jgi:hypothetical protein
MRTTALVLPVLLALTTATLTAKGATVRLVVTGPELKSPVVIDSPDALQGNVFEGNFIGSRASEPDPRLARHTVSFYAETPRHAVRMIYALSYVFEPRTGHGFVYLPRRGEPFYTLNVSTIMRGQEGEWHGADQRWSDAIATVVRERR